MSDDFILDWIDRQLANNDYLYDKYCDDEKLKGLLTDIATDNEVLKTIKYELENNLCHHKNLCPYDNKENKNDKIHEEE